jgi:hypothetical protein
LIREAGLHRLARAVARDRVIDAVCKSAAKARRKRTIEPIICKRGRDPTKRFRHRAVRVDGADVEPVHHIRNRKICPSGGTTYAVTSLAREELESSMWTIFHVDVSPYRRRVIRSRSLRLLKALFPTGGQAQEHLHPARPQTGVPALRLPGGRGQLGLTLDKTVPGTRRLPMTADGRTRPALS